MSALDLTFASGPDVLARLALEPGEYVVGRMESCEIVIDLPGIADRHARLCLDGAGGWVENLSSLGTTLDGVPVKARAAFTPGQRIDFGAAASLRVENRNPPPVATTDEAKNRKSRKKAAPKKKTAAPPQGVAPEPHAPEELDELFLLRREVDTLRAKHRKDVEALMAARVAAESDLKIVREALIVKQAAAARHLREMEDAHAARVKTLEEELRSVPVPAPIPVPVISVEATVVRAKPPRSPLPEYPPELPPSAGRIARRDDEFANVVGLLHTRESQLMEARASLRRVEDRCAEQNEQLAKTYGAMAKVDRWRKLCATSGIVVVAAIIGIASLSSMVRNESERAERAELVVQRIKSSAPRFASDAVELLEQGDFEPALVKAVAAVTLDPQSSRLKLLQGNILQSMLQLDAAAASYRESLALDPKQSLAAANLLLCQRILATRKGVNSPESLYALHRAMMDQERFSEALRMADRLPTDRQLLRQTWAALLDTAKLHGDLQLDEEGTFELDLSGIENVDLGVLKGMPLRTLKLGRSGVSDLSELRGLPLRRLDLSGTRVRDLSPLQGMSLEQLNLADTDVTNVFALRGMPLRELVLDHAPVTSIAELRGMPLETLRLAGTKVWSTQPLAGLPLKTLDLSRTRVAEIGGLEHLPIEWLDLEGTAVSDLRPLAGSSVVTLNLARTPASDLTPLSGLPLRHLNLGGCTGIQSVRALLSCLELERLVVPQRCPELALLRELPRLRFLSFGPAPAGSARDPSAREFWAAFAERETAGLSQ